MKILIAGYTYIKENYFNTFNFYPEKDKILFLLPRIWKAKGGKVKFYPPQKDNVYTASAYFYHSNYPIIGGLLKGWMPLFPLCLLKIKGLKTVYSPNEPVLLTTLYQGLWTRLFGKKHVIFSWENISYDKKFKGWKGYVQKLVLKLNLILCDAVVCGNSKCLEIFNTLTKKPVELIPLSGIDDDFFKKTNAKKEFGNFNLEKKVVFTFAGAIGYRKGIHLIIESLPEAMRQIPNIYLIIVGSGEYEEDLKFRVKSLQLEDVVVFIPWTNKENLKKILSVTDVFVYPSISYGGWEEQFGYSMAEASLMELPVISTRSGSIEEVVVNGRTGILIEPGNIDQLVEAMIKLANDPDLRKELGVNGRKFISERYGYQIVADKFYKFFQSL